jgi:hypothetical protein
VLRTGCRMRRAVASESSPITCDFAARACRRAPVAGRHASIVSSAMKLANASFSQMSSHHAIVTRSPNHWCASSCAMMLAAPTRAASDA